MLCSIHSSVYVSGVDSLGLFPTVMDGCYYPKVDVSRPESPEFMYSMGGVYGDMKVISSFNIGNHIIWSLEHFFFQEESQDEKGYLLYSEIVGDGHTSSPADTDVWNISDIDLKTLGVAEGVSVTCGCSLVEPSVNMLNVSNTIDESVNSNKVLIIEISLVGAFIVAFVIFVVVRMKKEYDSVHRGVTKRVEELDVEYAPV